MEGFSSLTATFKDSRSGEHTAGSGRAFHVTIASGQKRILLIVSGCLQLV